MYQRGLWLGSEVYTTLSHGRVRPHPHEAAQIVHQPRLSREPRPLRAARRPHRTSGSRIEAAQGRGRAASASLPLRVADQLAQVAGWLFTGICPKYYFE